VRDPLLVTTSTGRRSCGSKHLRTRLAVKDESQLEVVAAFLASGLMGLLTWWLDNQAPLSADDMYARFEHMATHGVRPS